MSSQRTYDRRVELPLCLRRSVRSGLTGFPPHTGTEHRCWSSARTGEGEKGHVFREIRQALWSRPSVCLSLDFTSQMVQMLHREPGRNAGFSEADSSSPENILHFRFFEFRLQTRIQHFIKLCGNRN